jgi:hypothetical protein
VLAGTTTAPAKPGHGTVETIRALRAARSGAIKARTAAPLRETRPLLQMPLVARTTPLVQSPRMVDLLKSRRNCQPVPKGSAILPPTNATAAHTSVETSRRLR